MTSSLAVIGYNEDSMDIDIYAHRIHHLVRNYTEKIKYENINRESNNIYLNFPQNSQILLSNGKKNQLIDQLISEAIVHFTRCVWEKKEPKVARDILHHLSGENGRRKLYGTLIQDSRRRRS